jgi:hypothetical protein
LGTIRVNRDQGEAGEKPEMGVLQHEMYQKTGAWTFEPGHSGRGDSATTIQMMPAGWWVMPGVVLGLGLWALIGVGLHAALTGDGDAAERVTMAVPMDGDLYAGE